MMILCILTQSSIKRRYQLVSFSVQCIVFRKSLFHLLKDDSEKFEYDKLEYDKSVYHYLLRNQIKTLIVQLLDYDRNVSSRTENVQNRPIDYTYTTLLSVDPTRQRSMFNTIILLYSNRNEKLHVMGPLKCDRGAPDWRTNQTQTTIYSLLIGLLMSVGDKLVESQLQRAYLLFWKVTQQRETDFARWKILGHANRQLHLMKKVSELRLGHTD